MMTHWCPLVAQTHRSEAFKPLHFPRNHPCVSFFVEVPKFGRRKSNFISTTFAPFFTSIYHLSYRIPDHTGNASIIIFLIYTSNLYMYICIFFPMHHTRAFFICFQSFFFERQSWMFFVIVFKSKHAPPPFGGGGVRDQQYHHTHRSRPFLSHAEFGYCKFFVFDH